jgi:hypothetical protein
VYSLTPDAVSRIATDRCDDAVVSAAAYRATHPPDRSDGRRWAALSTLRDRLARRNAGRLDTPIARPRRA